MNIQEKVKAFFSGGQSRGNLIALTFLALIAGFWAYSRYVNRNQTNLPEQVSVQTNKENIGSISGGSIGPEEKKNTENGSVAGLSTETNKASMTTAKEIWTARQIDRNSIKDKTYTVQKGDTLWQIAQGKYGSGFEWKKILETNKDKIGFLPNGSQALIEIGQELSLP